MLFVHRTRGVAAAALGVLVGLGACSDPELNTDLRPEGPPDVLAVLVMSDAAGQIHETATYCKPNDPLRPTLVGLPDFTTEQVCPDTGEVSPAEDAYPDGWYVRIMFDELLDPSIEELSPILDEETGEETGNFSGSLASAHPVELQCRSVVSNQMVDVDYDGYYSPSGNRVTWPLGPSLVIKPNDPSLIATNTECEIKLNDNILDKDGIPVPEAQRGPFPFKVSGIKVILLDPPADDAEYEAPIDAVVVYYDNFFAQFNTAIDPSTLCPDEDDDGLCDDDAVFSITDNEHPAQGPGYCDTTGMVCGQLSDCDVGMGDTLCGKGFCGITGGSCNVKADCPDADEHCGTSYIYDYVVYGGSETEYGLGPVEPVQTDRKYTFQIKAGSKLKDRCGRETTLPAPDKGGDDDDDTTTTNDDNLFARFITEKFDLNSTTIQDGAVSSGINRLQYNFNNVVWGSDTASDGSGVVPTPAFEDAITAGNFTISPMPQKMTGPCTAPGVCPTSDLTPDELMIVSPFADGQPQMQGHLKMATEYTVTMKAATVIKDFYGVPWSPPDGDTVIKFKTQPAITLTSIAVRNTGQVFSIGNNGTLTKDVAGNTTDIRFSFNASIDPTSFEMADWKIEPAVAGFSLDPADVTPSGCGYWEPGESPDNATGWYPGCIIRARGLFMPGTYKITFLKGAKVKDNFGLEYTHPEDTTITIDVEEPSATGQCL